MFDRSISKMEKTDTPRSFSDEIGQSIHLKV